jgi:uncharacterized phage protein gp47/JayE
MVTILSVNDVILNMINTIQLSQPNATINPGSVIRDIAIDSPASQIALIYDELSKVSSQQSLALVSGSDLDKLAKNFGLTRKQAVASNGIALLTFAAITGTININVGDIVTANNGFSFSVLNGLAVASSNSNYYKSVATTFANSLQYLGITDQYAVQVTVQATTAGSGGNVGQYSLISTTIAGVSNVTNTSPFTGGSDQEDDATFRNRILSVFSGSSIGTALGYKNTALAVSGVTDAYVIGPGDPLMTRDGTITTTDAQGNITIVSEGTGGKVNIAILGTDLTQYTDSFIYQDKSNKNDPTNPANNFVLGQIPSNANMSFNQKRLTDIAAGVLPAQPVNAILQVTGSLSGSNFVAQSTDENGVVSGNYELIKDTSVYGGSPWGFDTFHWISNQITGFQEDDIKGQINGQDTTTYSSVLQIPNVSQNLSITNENSTVIQSNNSLIQLLHSPATNVTRVFNVSTGEQYTIANQNPNGTGLVNTSGIIQISGNTLPTPSNVLQVDYTWVISYDQFMDYDGKLNTNNPRVIGDSIDWSFSNLVRSEYINFILNSSSTFFVGSASLPVSSIISCSTFNQAFGVVSQVSSGSFAGRLCVLITNLPSSPTSVNNVFFQHTYEELYQTAMGNGSFSVSSVISGINLLYTATIILPTDTMAAIGSNVSVILNEADTFNIVGMNGSINQNQITIPAANIYNNGVASGVSSIVLNAVYSANEQTFLASGITTLPISRLGNGYSLNNGAGFNNNNLANTMRREFQTVQENLSSQFYVELSLSSLYSTLIPSQIISVIRLTDGYELWNNDNQGSIAIDENTNDFQLILSGYNAPATGNNVLIIYQATDISRFQPFAFENEIIERDFETISYDPTNGTYVLPIHDFIASSGISFEIILPGSNVILASGTDGYLIPNSPASAAIFSSTSQVSFSTLKYQGIPVNLLNYRLRILNNSNINNNNTYDIANVNVNNNQLTIGNNFESIALNQISVIREVDGQELWSNNGSISISNNQLTFPQTSAANSRDRVIILFYKYGNLKQASTRIAATITDQVVNTGTLAFVGTTLTKAASILFVATASGLHQNLLAAYRTFSGLSTASSIPSNVYLAKIATLQKVNTTTPGGGEVLDVIATYDLTGATFQNNTFFSNEFFSNLSLGQLDFILPNTTNNTSNAPAIGDTLQATFYYATSGNTENLVFSRNGTLYTNNSFATIDRIYIASGFNVSQSATLSLANLNQPITGSRYTTTYNYLAPQPNERIIINYNYNELISTVTFAIENSRPINADVLVQAAGEILVDVLMDIVIAQSALSNTTLITQNVQNAIVSAINSTTLGTTLDGSSLVNAAFGVSGVAAARIVTFNVDGQTGQQLFIVAQNNQYLVANNISVAVVAN